MLERWLQTAAEAAETDDADPALLGAEALAVVLDLARDAAHGVARPAAPLLATFVAGLAVGRSGGGLPGLQAVAARLTAAAGGWEGQDESSSS